MKTLIRDNSNLSHEGRWDIDFHLPPELIREYPDEQIVTVADLALVSNLTRDPSLAPDESFRYVDIASVDVTSGTITSPQELTGEEAPSRARMVIKAFDVLVSTVRPTRRAVAVVPSDLHNGICSTGFTVLRCREGINPFFLHFLLRLPSTAEQFRKFATGSSYPAILDSDVLKTAVPWVAHEQDAIARAVVAAQDERQKRIEDANDQFNTVVAQVEGLLKRGEALISTPAPNERPVSVAEIAAALDELAAPSPDIAEAPDNQLAVEVPVDG